LNLNVHIHSLVLDGVFTRSTPTAAPVFHALPAPTDAKVAEVLGKFHHRVQRLLRRRGRLPEEESSPTDPVAEQMPLLAKYASASIQGLVASGPRAGHPVRRLRSAAAVVDGAKPRCARLEGFSLHANVGVPAHARARLEHVCRYLLRPPAARERLTETAHGPLLFELAHPRADGTTHLLLEPLELIEKIALLIPPPRFHTLRSHGVLGPRAAWRSAVIPRRPEAVEEGPPAAERSEGTRPRAEPSPGSLGLPSESSMWAALLRRVSPWTSFSARAAAAGGGSLGSTPAARGCGSCSSGSGS
jgi:Putative transposase